MTSGSGYPLEDLQEDYVQLIMDFELLRSQKNRLLLKIRLQAEQITRLEASRKTLREQNKRYREHPNAW